MDIGLIKDKAIVAAPRRRPRVYLQPLSDNLEDTVELAQRADLATSKPTNTAPVESAPRTSRAPSSSRSTPPSTTLAPIAIVKKLEAYMATLLHNINPWM